MLIGSLLLLLAAVEVIGPGVIMGPLVRDAPGTSTAGATPIFLGPLVRGGWGALIGKWGILMFDATMISYVMINDAVWALSTKPMITIYIFF